MNEHKIYFYDSVIKRNRTLLIVDTFPHETSTDFDLVYYKSKLGDAKPLILTSGLDQYPKSIEYMTDYHSIREKTFEKMIEHALHHYIECSYFQNISNSDFLINLKYLELHIRQLNEFQKSEKLHTIDELIQLDTNLFNSNLLDSNLDAIFTNTKEQLLSVSDLNKPIIEKVPEKLYKSKIFKKN